jgi:hypothetical protein
MKHITVQIKQFVLNYLHLFIVIAAQFATTNLASQELTVKEYLKVNSQNIMIDSVNTFSIFDKKFYDNQVFLSSESHGYAKPHAIDAELFKHINKTTGARYYIAEVDMAQAKILNDYLKTGNDALLKSIYTYWYNEQAQWGCKAGFEKWKKIYLYNKTLPQAKKITVLGLDHTQDYEMNLNYILDITKTNQYKKGKLIYIDSAIALLTQNLKKDTTKRVLKFVRRWSVDIQKNMVMYKKLIKKNYFEFSFIVNNMASKKDRETTITENFLTFVTHYKLDKEKFYGFWGRFHAMQDSINGDVSFSARIKKKFKVVSMPIFCTESASMLPTAYLPAMVAQKGTVYTKVDMVNDDSFIYKVNGIVDFKNATPTNGITIFRLDAANSPFTKGLNLINSKSDFDKTFNWKGASNSVTTDYMQYAIIARGSTWAEPFGDNIAK